MVGFYRIAKFPGVTGCIECTHIRIKSPGIKQLTSAPETPSRGPLVWKRRFSCLDMGLQHLAERSAVITTACAGLHNLAVLRQDPNHQLS
ncbi:hypothetical protein HPB52_024789 [Rhipicephalus sanguineus]|uniref:Nuclease HARBI1 n=1 Tax=Rhipicephalus sanguineus TaxID=34632 RepID=A0A9D4TDW4_RHISA|nr:hypothetical protein HPB52_024789 [Rhipicephalus sanguineus]